ncbi:MAG: helix-turn-helix domain-containing protein [Aeromicrobium sp.]
MAAATVSKAKFFDAAFEILSDEGFAGLKQSELCRSLNVTTGAFYHHFKSWKDFTDQFLAHWHEARTTELVEVARQQFGPEKLLEALIDIALTLPHRAEAAIRVWSNLDPYVQSVQESVDLERFTIIVESALDIVSDPKVAATFAKTGMYLLIGFEQYEKDSHTEALEWSMRLVLESARKLSEENS